MLLHGTADQLAAPLNPDRLALAYPIPLMGPHVRNEV